MHDIDKKNTLRHRFRGFYPVTVDVETAGFNAQTDALLEIAVSTLKMDESGWLKPEKTIHFHIVPFEGSIIRAEALAFTGIDPDSALRGAISEKEALTLIFKIISEGIKSSRCNRAIMVAHNAAFDLGFIKSAAKRAKMSRNPFHPFVTLDTATLSGLALGQTVLAKSCATAGLDFDSKQAHSALYDSERTAMLFCEIVNRWKKLGGWPPELKSK
jgi:ribonuclease T